MDKTNIETQIREVLRSELDAIVLSNKLFSPGGLFHQLAPSKAERQTVSQSPLFKEAQQRLADLRRKEATEFANKIVDAESVLGAARLHKLEGV
jgi:hypothetical protein